MFCCCLYLLNNLLIILQQLESSLAEKSQMLESVQGLKNSLEGQLKDALGSKVWTLMWSLRSAFTLDFCLLIFELCFS